MTGTVRDDLVLIVEDDVAVREALSEVLEDRGYSLMLAGNGREALERLHQGKEKPCVILLDIMMPVMDGREFRAVQKSDPTINDIPIVVLSAHANVEEAAVAMEASEALRKPVALDTLVSVVSRFCRAPEPS